MVVGAYHVGAMIRWLLLASIAAILGLLAGPSALLYRGTLGYTALVPRVQPDGPPPTVVEQYLGLASDASNCGPASVASVLEWARPELAGMDPAALVSQVRSRSGEPFGDTDQQGLAQALGSFGVPVAQLYAGDVAGGEGDPLAVVTAMLGRGSPVLALVHGATLGRGEGYGNHWIVLWRDDRRAGTIEATDPDTQPPRSAAWIPGGMQSLRQGTVRAALSAVGGDAPVALAIGAERRYAVPARMGLFAAALLMALVGLARRVRGGGVAAGYIRLTARFQGAA